MNPYALYHGDCLEVMRTIPDASVDAVITDPPYGTTACMWDSVIPFTPMWKCITRILKPRGVCLLFGAQPFTSALVMSNPKWFRYDWIWHKTMALGFLAANRRPLRSHEHILVFAKGHTRYNPQKASGFAPDHRHHAEDGPKYQGYRSHTRRDWDGSDGTRFPRSVITFSNHNGAIFGRTATTTVHPTQKPVALLAYLVRTYTNEGDMVLDFTMGSGSTGVAALTEGRRFIGIEKDSAFFALAAARLAAAHQGPERSL